MCLRLKYNPIVGIIICWPFPIKSILSLAIFMKNLFNLLSSLLCVLLQAEQ